MATIAITGAGGYIGSKLSSELQKKYDIVPLDNFYNAQVKDIHSTKIIDVDITHKEKLSALLDVDAVVHLAAISDVEVCELHPDLGMQVNVGGTQNVALICYQKGIPLIFASSMAVFGNPQYSPVNEQHPRNPINFYARTKALGEQTIYVLSKEKFASYILIKSNVYGIHYIDNKKIEKKTVINTFVEKAIKNEDLTIYKPGTQIKNFLHITDAVAAYTKAVENILEEKEKKTKFFCLGGEETLTIKELGYVIEDCAKAKGFNSPVILVDNPRKGKSPTTLFSVDLSRIQDELGFTSSYTLKKGIEEFFR
ncbi:MAG: NAD(P)-dependent oxidoreductase [Candidatus Methanofastidiosia archaeon]